MLGVGFWVLIIGHWVLGVRYGVFGFWVLSVGHLLSVGVLGFAGC